MQLFHHETNPNMLITLYGLSLVKSIFGAMTKEKEEVVIVISLSALPMWTVCLRRETK